MKPWPCLTLQITRLLDTSLKLEVLVLQSSYSNSDIGGLKQGSGWPKFGMGHFENFS